VTSSSERHKWESHRIMRSIHFWIKGSLSHYESLCLFASAGFHLDPWRRFLVGKPSTKSSAFTLLLSSVVIVHHCCTSLYLHRRRFRRSSNHRWPLVWLCLFAYIASSPHCLESSRSVQLSCRPTSFPVWEVNICGQLHWAYWYLPWKGETH